MRPSIAAGLVAFAASTLAAPGALGAEPKAAPKESPPAFGWNFDGVWVTPVIAPAYTPELELFVSAGGMVSWKNDKKSPRSSFPASIGYSTTGAIVYSGFLKSYWSGDQLRFDLDSWYKDMPDHYFGIGYDNGKNTPLGDDTTAYHRLWWQLKATTLKRLVSDLFVGVLVDGNHTTATQLNPKMAADPDVLDDGSEILDLGVGPVVRYDSRDFPQNAYSGVFLQLLYLPYLTLIGNHVGYRILDFDYRQYLTVGHRGSTLAWTVRWRRGFGEVPWTEEGVLGSSNDLRGYRAGRYRDTTIGYAIIEYRYMIPKRRQPDGSVELSRHGLVGWLGAGLMGEALIEPDGWLPNGGIGYRFEVQERLNARLDFGRGRESQGVYFAFTEAF